MSVADSITSFKQLAGDTLTPGSGLMPQGDKKDEEEEEEDDDDNDVIHDVDDDDNDNDDDNILSLATFIQIVIRIINQFNYQSCLCNNTPT